MSVAPLPVISIIVTTHNRPNLLKRALEALRRLYGRPEFEIIVIDDLGLPETLRVVADQCPSNLVYFLRRDGPGVAKSRNRGVAMARGRWITFCDDDDALVSEWLDWALVNGDRFSSYVLVASFEKIQESRAQDPPVKLASKVISLAPENITRLQITNNLPIGCYLLPTNIARANAFDEQLQSHEDWDFLLKVQQSARFAIAPVISCKIYEALDDTERRSLENRKHFISDYIEIYKRFPTGVPEIVSARESFLRRLGHE